MDSVNYPTKLGKRQQFVWQEPYGLRNEIEEFYDIDIKRDESEEDAALYACSEWDILELGE